MHLYALLAAVGTFSGSIIPAGTGAENPQLCAAGWSSLVELVNNLIKFAIYLAIIICVLVAAYGGFLLVLNPINAEYRSKAKSMFMNAGIGLVLALAAWLIVNTLLMTLSGGAKNISTFTSFLSGGDVCIQAKAGTGFDVTGSGNPSLSAGNSTSASTATCTGTNGNPQTLTGNAAGAYQYSNQISSLASQDGVSDQTNQLLGVIAQESGGRTNAVSNIPQKDGTTGHAYGLMQLTPETAAQYGVGACQGSTRTNASSACVSALEDPTTNMAAGVKYYSALYSQNNGDVTNATAAYNGGQGANGASATCAGQTKWQCTANAGYAQTRNYVNSVSMYANTIGGCTPGSAETTTSASASSNNTIEAQPIDLSGDSGSSFGI